jgi:hypothetical protein
MLDYHTTHEVLDFLDSDTLRQVSTLNKMYNTKYRELIYYRHALENKLLYSLSYFLKDEFGIPKLEEGVQELFDYIETRQDLFVAGGFMTQLYMGLVPKTTSDIDIYLLAKESIRDGGITTFSLVEQVRQLMAWIENRYSIIGMIRTGSFVYTIFVKEIEYPIQIIVTTNGTAAEILSGFDNSHNRCGLYMGHTYIGVDTKLSHQNKISYFYSTPKINRYQKAIELGFSVFGLTESELKRIMSEPKITKPQILQKYKLENILLDVLGRKSHKKWTISYCDEELVRSCYDIEEVNIEKGLSDKLKKELSNIIITKYAGDHKVSRLVTELKEPRSQYLKIRKPLMLQYVFTIRGSYICDDRLRKILIKDKNEIEKIKKIKENELELFKLYHGSNNNGYEYYDGINLYDSYAEIRNIEIGIILASWINVKKDFTISMTPIIRYDTENKICTWGACRYMIKTIE